MQQPLFLHFSQLCGHGAAIHIQIVRQLLAIEGNIKFPAALTQRLKGQIRQQSAADASGTGMNAPAGQTQIFL